MKAELFLAVTKSGSIRMTRRNPSLARDEVGVRVKLAIPDTSFRAPIVEVNVDVPEDRIILPAVEAEVLAGEPFTR